MAEYDMVLGSNITPLSNEKTANPAMRTELAVRWPVAAGIESGGHRVSLLAVEDVACLAQGGGQPLGE
jgi:hypothetical protein